MARRIIKEVNLKDVKFDESVYPRTSFDWRTAYDYANSLKAGAKFPPITLALFNRQLILVDGKHRLEAYKQCKQKTIKAEVFTGWDKKKIFVEAVQRNIAHGRILSPFEKRKIILKLREMKLSQKDISVLVQIPQEKIEEFVGQRLINSLTGDDETFEVVKSEIKHTAGRSYEPEEFNTVLKSQKSMRQVSQLSLLNEVIVLFEKKLIDLTDKEIVKRVLKLWKLLVLAKKEVKSSF